MKNRRGFTLAELLIVVAIVAVLVAVAVPVLGTQLEKAKEAKDLASIRVALEEISQYSLDPQLADNNSGTDNYSKPSIKDGVVQVWVKTTQTMKGWQMYEGKTEVEIYSTKVAVPETGENAHWEISLDNNLQKYTIKAVG